MTGIIRSSDLQNLNYMQCGMGALFVAVVNCLVRLEYENFNYKPYIDFTDPNVLFYEKDGVDNIFNVWEYYFEQEKPESEIYEFSNYVKSHFNSELWVNAHSKMNQDIIRKAYFVIQKYIKLKPNLSKNINSFYDKHMLGNKILGVHIRGTDKEKEMKMFSPDIWVEEANKLINKFNLDKVLICSDEEKYVDKFKSSFGNKCLYTDSMKSNNRQGVHFQQYNRELDNYKKGFEAIRDFILLSKCNNLLVAYSNVSASAIIYGGFKTENIKYIY